MSKLTELEIKTLAECNAKVNKYGLKVEKIKIKRTYYYYILKNDKRLLGNDNLVQFKSFCDNENDIKTLSSIS